MGGVITQLLLSQLASSFVGEGLNKLQTHNKYEKQTKI